MRSGPLTRSFAWLCIWLWVLGPVSAEFTTGHAHAGVDPCELPSVVHDAHQHRIDAKALSLVELSHCHACHMPRAQVVETRAVFHAVPLDTLPAQRPESGPESCARVSLPPRSPPALAG